MTKQTKDPEVKKVSKKEEKKNVLQLLSIVFGIPQVGITLEESMGNKPYINSLGLEFAKNKFPEAVVIETITFHKLYEKIGDSAIVFVEGIYGRDKRGDVGTASAANLNLVRNYPNEMAVTRAVNRFLRRGLLPLLYANAEEVLKTLSTEEYDLVAPYMEDFGRVSAEELSTVTEEQVQPEVFITEGEMGQIKPFLEALTEASTQEELDDITTNIKIVKDKLNEKQLQKLRQTFENVRKEKNLI